jgi:uncharacterized protein
MEPENPSSAPKPPTPVASPIEPSRFLSQPGSGPPEPNELGRLFFGPKGLRAGWSIAIFFSLLIGGLLPFGTVFSELHLTGGRGDFSAKSALFGELGGFLAMVIAAWVVSRIERRRLLDYNLAGPRRARHFAQGFAAGFAALTLLVGMLDWGGWLHFGPVALSGEQILILAGLWGSAFILVGFVEEGIMRCFLLFTLARSMNFWWAIGLVALMCGDLLMRARGNGAWGVYLMALLGAGPCVWLFVKKIPEAGFWYAAWVTSTFFGFGHTGNKGETWIGIFAAAAIGFVFCVSVRVTGSAWWAIGCHAAWDWAETYFYGTADSGIVAKGHYLTTTLSGPAFWSGGSDGPEGSVLVLGVIALLLMAILLLYRRQARDAAPAAHSLHPAAG